MDITLVKHGSLTRWTFQSAENGYVRVNSIAEYTNAEAAATICELKAQGWSEPLLTCRHCSATLLLGDPDVCERCDLHLNAPFATDEFDEFGNLVAQP